MNLFEWLSTIIKQFFAFFENIQLPKAPAKPVDKPVEKPVDKPKTPGVSVIAPDTEAEYITKYYHAVILPQHLGSVKAKVKLINSQVEEYKAVEMATGVPWKVVSAISSLESGNNMKACLHNGEQIIGTGRKTTLVPAGRGPFATWHEAAIDALGGKNAHQDKREWSVGKWLDFLEKYNGLGYRRRKLDSPYLWSFTSEQRTTGKYVSDGVFDPNAVSKQMGCVAILKGLDFKA